MMEFVHRFELPRISREHRQPVEKVTVVLLCSHGGDSVSVGNFLSFAAIRWFKGMLAAGSSLYPYSAERTVVFRSPWYASTGYRYIRPLMHPETAARVVLPSYAESEMLIKTIINTAKTVECL